MASTSATITVHTPQGLSKMARDAARGKGKYIRHELHVSNNGTSLWVEYETLADDDPFKRQTLWTSVAI